MTPTAILEGPQAAAALTQLDQLKKFTRIVADTGDFATLKEYAPQDATTNPPLILKAAIMPEYRHLREKPIADTRSASIPAAGRIGHAVDSLLVSAMAFSTRCLYSGM